MLGTYPQNRSDISTADRYSYISVCIRVDIANAFYILQVTWLPN